MPRPPGRRHFLSRTAAVVASAPWTWSARAASPIGFDEARHLLSRTSFGVTLEHIRSIEALDYGTAVDRLLDERPVDIKVAAPAWIEDSPEQASRSKAQLAAEKRKAKREGLPAPKLRPGQDQRRDLQFWWIEEMLVTDRPIRERMVLFWHNHFTSSLKKVHYMPALYRQNMLFRREALGNFAALLKEVARDPAMLIYLDGARSVARQPNENFARELLGLFTLGEGHYGETDIKQAARAFTGWGIDHAGRFAMYGDQHDNGEKNVLGKTGNLDGNDVLDVLLAHPQTAVTIVRKLWREFVSLTPDDGEVVRLADLFRKGNYEIRPLLRALFESRFFRDPANRGSLIKSPIDLVVGTVHVLGVSALPQVELLRMLQSLGQVPFDPPNVKGWPGGKRWITSYSLLLRQQFLRRVIDASNVTTANAAMSGAKPSRHGKGRMSPAGDDSTMQLGPSGPSDRAPQSMHLPADLARAEISALVRTLLPTPPIAAIPSESPDAAAAAAVLDFAYQLK